MITITLDFETYYDVHFSLTKMTTPQYVNSPDFKVWGVGIKVEDQETVWFQPDEIQTEFDTYNWEDVALVCQNTPFDAYILSQYYGITNIGYYYDTAAMSRGMYPGQSASLAPLAERLWPADVSMRKGTELVNAKGIRELTPELDKEIGGYCIQDCELTYAAWEKMRVGYPQKELDLIDLTTRMYVEPKLVLDPELCIAHRDKHKKAGDDAVRNSGVDRTILSSNPQFAQYIDDTLGIVVPTKKSPRTGKMIPALGKTDSAYIQMCTMYPEHKHIWAGRSAVKSRIEETRAERFLQAVNKDGSFSAPLKYYAAHTGRFGGTEKLNLQNLPRSSQLRRAIQAPAGSLLYVSDLANIEARMLAWLANEPYLLNSFAAGEDVYSEFASQIYNRKITKENKLERYVGKTAVLGLGYGMGADKFKYTLSTGSPSVDLSDTAAKTIVNQYRTYYPNIPGLWAQCKQLLYNMLDQRQSGNMYGPLTVGLHQLGLPNGMALKYPMLTYSSLDGNFMYVSYKRSERLYGPKLCENIVQALARIVLTDQMLTLQQDPDLDVVLTVHDEIILKGPDTNCDVYMDRILEVMRTPPDWCKDLPLDAEGGYDVSYSK
jgi:DNA polymerase